MNVNSGFVRREDELTEQERQSGQWIRLPADYVPKSNPVTDDERARVLAAEAKRLRKAQRRLESALVALERKRRMPKPPKKDLLNNPIERVPADE